MSMNIRALAVVGATAAALAPAATEAAEFPVQSGGRRLRWTWNDFSSYSGVGSSGGNTLLNGALRCRQLCRVSRSWCTPRRRQRLQIS